MASRNPPVKFTKIFINNEWCDSVSGRTFETLNPATGQKIATVQEGGKADVDKAVEAARKAFQLGSSWRTSDATYRGQLLRNLIDIIKEDAEHIASLEMVDNGKPYGAALEDVLVPLTLLEFYAGYADKLSGKTVPIDGDYFAYTRLEPIGVVGIIVSWDFPFSTAMVMMAPAICAGCTIVIKPSEKTPLTTIYLGSLIEKAGFPPGVFNVVPGYGVIAGAALTRHSDVDKIIFVGSTEVGKLVQKASALSNLKQVTLGLSGKSPFVVSQHADLTKALKTVQLACFLNQGQTCCAATRIFVHETIHDTFVTDTVQMVLKRKLGDPFDKDTDQGPQIDQEQLDKILELIESGIKEGASLKCGGRRHGIRGFYVEPTVFTDVQDDMRIAREEIFGPVILIFKYKTLDEVIERSNDTQYGLAAGIVTDDLEEAIQYINSVRVSTVWVNDYFNGSGVLPYGGYKQSGIGRIGGEEGLHEFVQVKTVSIKIRQKNA